MNRLTENQIEKLNDLYKAVLEHAEKERPTRVDSRDLDVSNTFGIFGPRGAGKTTLLSHVSPPFHENVGGGLKASLDKLIFPPPIDCSSLRQEIHPGMAVFLSLRKILRGEDHPMAVGTRNFDTLNLKIRQELEDELNQLLGLYSQVGESYHNFCSEISSTPDDRVHYINQGLLSRMELGEKITSWLDKALEALGSQVFVVRLDDFDLVDGHRIRDWMLTLLDEFRQPRLLFVLAADFYRLSHLSWDPERDFDDKTGRALLDKFLPLQNCIHLSAWSSENRESYKPHSETDITLGQCIGRQMPDRDIFQPLQPIVLELLPRWPRGLQSLYASLFRLAELNEPGSQMAADERLKRLLRFLARSRGEQLLARRLDEDELRSWVVNLKFKAEVLSLEDWQTLVELAGRRASLTKESLAALHGLEPVLEGIEDTPNIKVSQTTRTVEIPDLWSRASISPDPLRHDLLHVLPLRDAEKADQGLWTELLIDTGFLSAPHRRADFLVRWAPVRDRSARCSLDQRFSRRELRAFFQENAGALSVDVLAWLREDGTDTRGEKVRFGWQPLVESLRDANTFWSSRLAEILLVRPEDVRSRDAGQQSFDPARLLPSRLWALILLIDQLDRCPWRAFSVARGWFVSTYLCLAAAFVRSAYVAALNSVGLLEKISGPQGRLVAMLNQRDPSDLLRNQEEDLLLWLHEIFDDDLAQGLETADDVLSKAAYAYLSSPWYESIVFLLKSQTLIQEHLAAEAT